MFINLEEEDVDSWGRWLPGSWDGLNQWNKEDAVKSHPLAGLWMKKVCPREDLSKMFCNGTMN